MTAQPATRKARRLRLCRADARRACASPSCQVTAGPASRTSITGMDMVSISPRLPRSGGRLEGGEAGLLDVLLDEAGLLHQVEDLLLALDPVVVEVGRRDEPVELVVQPVGEEGELLVVADGEVLRVGLDDLVPVVLPLLDAAIPELDQEGRLLLVLLDPRLAGDEHVRLWVGGVVGVAPVVLRPHLR